MRSCAANPNRSRTLARLFGPTVRLVSDGWRDPASVPLSQGDSCRRWSRLCGGPSGRTARLRLPGEHRTRGRHPAWRGPVHERVAVVGDDALEEVRLDEPDHEVYRPPRDSEVLYHSFFLQARQDLDGAAIGHHMLEALVLRVVQVDELE